MKWIVRMCCMFIVLVASYSYGGEFKLESKLADGTKIKVTVKTIPVPANFPYRNSYNWGGDVDSPPKTIISEIRIRAGNRDIFVPLSVYSDLGWVQQVSLEKGGNVAKLLMTGGDAGASYDVEMKFNKINLLSRRVRHGEFPEDVWEETIYSEPDITD